MAPKLDQNEARQGSSGRPVLLILIAAVVLVVVGYLLIGGIGTATSPDGSLEQTESIGDSEPAANATTGETVTPQTDDAETNEGVNVPN